MGIEEFISKYGEQLKKGILQENCINDFFNVVLEINSSLRSSIRHQIIRLFEYLLKYQYEPNKQSRSWINTIRDSSSELYDFSTDKKNKKYWKEYLEENDIDSCYNTAVMRVSAQTGLDRRSFPDNTPYDIEVVINTVFIEDFLREYAYSNEVKKILF